MSRFSKTHLNNPFPMPGSKPFAVKKSRLIPHEFVLDAIASLSPRTHPMFGCLAVYVEDKIVLALRDKQDHAEDNGVWLATTKEHHESLHREFPSMRSIHILRGDVTGWQVLPAEGAHFEEEALRACELVVAGDPRIGKIPGAKRSAMRGAGNKEKSSKPAKKTRGPVKGLSRR